MQERRIHDTMPDELLDGFKRMASDLAAARRVRNISQEDLAKRLNVGRKSISRMENGDHTVSFGLIAGSAWVLGLQKELFEVFSPEKDPVFIRDARLDVRERAGRKRSPAQGVDEGLDF